MTITDDEFILDYTGTHPQVAGSINCTLVNLGSRARALFRAVTTPDVPTNGGMYRPLKVICPPGTVFSAQHPAPVSTYYESAIMALDVAWKAIAPHVPQSLSAGNLSSTASIAVSGKHLDTGEFWMIFGPFVGGWGAEWDHDGGRGQFGASNGQTFNIPVEITEARYSVQVEQYAYHTEPGGHGRFRGGNGVYLDYRILSDTATLSASVGRHKFPPWAVEGGHPGTCSYARVFRQDGGVEDYGKYSGVRLAKGDLIRLATATGGGWGDTKERDPAMVADDLRNGFITVDVARDVYGQ